MFSRNMIDVEREERRVCQQVKRAIEAGVLATLTLDQWLDTIMLFQGLCAYCQKKPFEVLDHLYPVCSGGSTTQNNCVPACASCNGRKGSHIGDDVSGAKTLLEAAEKTWASLHINPDIRRYRGPYADWGEIQLEAVRFPRDIWQHLKDFAKEDGRSFNGEVIWILRKYIADRSKRETPGEQKDI